MQTASDQMKKHSQVSAMQQTLIDFEPNHSLDHLLQNLSPFVESAGGPANIRSLNSRLGRERKTRQTGSQREPAGKLLGRIRAKKGELEESKGISPRQQNLKLEKLKQPFVVNDGWEWTRLEYHGLRRHLKKSATARTKLLELGVMKCSKGVPVEKLGGE
jgi:hypothetical protein